MKFPEDPAEERRFVQGLPPSVAGTAADQRDELTKKRSKFFRDEGVLAILNSSDASRDGLVFAQSAGSFDAKDSLAVAYVRRDPGTIQSHRAHHRKEDSGEDQGQPANGISDRNVDAYNIIGEIPGGAKKDEVVMIGAHFDSWHSGTGATDNGAGSAVMIEVMRVLKALNLKLDRTVRIGIVERGGGGVTRIESIRQGALRRSRDHEADRSHMRSSPDISIWTTAAARSAASICRATTPCGRSSSSWLAPFRDQGVTTISIRNTGGTDHLSFDAVGLPGFQFIQDPLEYGTMTHHSNMDTIDHVQAADLMQAAAVIATVVYDAANRPDMLPRKALPQPQPKVKFTEEPSR